jgi:hypothetical protein
VCRGVNEKQGNFLIQVSSYGFINLCGIDLKNKFELKANNLIDVRSFYSPKEIISKETATGGQNATTLFYL